MLKALTPANSENKQLEVAPPVDDHKSSIPVRASAFVACVACHPVVDDVVAGTTPLPWESEMLYFSVKPGHGCPLRNNQRDGVLGMYNR